MTGCDLTRQAQNALRLARESSAQLGHGYVGSEHLLLGLLRASQSAAARALTAAGIQETAVQTAIAGLVGTILAAVGIMSKFTAFLTLLCALIPAFVGVIIADYWIVGKGKKENFVIRDGIFAPGMIAFLVGAVEACLTGGTCTYFEALAFLNVPFFIGPIYGLVLSIVLYVILVSVTGKNKTETEQVQA